MRTLAVECVPDDELELSRRVTGGRSDLEGLCQVPGAAADKLGQAAPHAVSHFSRGGPLGALVHSHQEALLAVGGPRDVDELLRHELGDGLVDAGAVGVGAERHHHQVDCLDRELLLRLRQQDGVPNVKGMYLQPSAAQQTSYGRSSWMVYLLKTCVGSPGAGFLGSFHGSAHHKEVDASLERVLQGVSKDERRSEKNRGEREPH